jgi:thioredoxin reductase (NADPH)
MNGNAAAAPASVYARRREQMFPALSQPQIERLRRHATSIETRAGEVLVEPGHRHGKVYVVLSGTLQAILPRPEGETPVHVLQPGEFTGELSTVTGAPGFARVRVGQPGSVLVMEGSQVAALIQTDAELSEIFMRAFILRRMGLVESEPSEVSLIGSGQSAPTLRLRAFLARNALPHLYLDLDTDPQAKTLLERLGIGASEIPVVIRGDGRMLKSPGIREMAAFLEMNPELDSSAVHDLVIVGAGPAGLSAAVYAASEGLEVLVLEAGAFGGQAGSSSKIENYLGFPTGISGQALAGRAFVQAEKFGARVSVACKAERLDCDRPFSIALSDGRAVLANTVIIATGAKYRELCLDNMPRFVGAGIYYAATHLEAKLCQGEEVAIVGGGNSAGQAALFLANGCRKVHMLVRSAGLAESMSSYLVRRIEENPVIALHTQTQLTAVAGADRLESIEWYSAQAGTEKRGIGHVFLMTGAVPNTGWLRGCVALDEKKFVRTGPELQARHLADAHWPLERPPHLLETSVPGIFAVGDVRSGNVKRVASAVGEGSICIQLVHRALAELASTAAVSKNVAAIA